jgi:superfamily II DNA or RNA helicase
MPHDIIDNQEQKLTDHVGRMLDNAAKAKFAVGYFFLSGFQAIADRLDKVEELRLLIGNATDTETIEQLAAGQNGKIAAASALEERKYRTKEQQNKLLENDEKTLSDIASGIDQSDDNEVYIKNLSRLIEQGKVKVRVYTKGTLHAKAYIVDYPDGRYERGSAIVGSSNLSLAGISSNTELNVVVPGNDNHVKLSEWFDKLWNESAEFDERLMKVLKNSWALNEPTPYELYLKVVYELVKDRLISEDEPHRAPRKGMPTLYRYQKDAVTQARNILLKQNGVFLADVVGFGKTYMGVGLLTDLYEREGWRALVICPPVLMKMWQRVIDDFDLNARVVSLGKLSDVLEDDRLMNREIILVDESHRFRNENTQRYKDLAEICFGKKVILLTATPQNTSVWDIYYQIKLFHPHEWIEAPIDPANLREFFKEAEAGQQSVPELLEHMLIRRNRRHIKMFYETDMSENKLQFPQRMPPERIDYSVDDVYPGFYDDIEKQLLKLRYARYDLWHYAKPEYRDDPEIAQLKTAGKNLVKLMRATFFKRLESSVVAFRNTLALLIKTHSHLLQYLDKGVVLTGPIGEDIMDAIRSGDEETEAEMLEKLEKQYPATKFDLARLRKHIEADLKIFNQLFKDVEPIKPENDAKLQTLIKELSKAEWKNQKVLLFTQFSATANYVGEQLQSHFDKVEYASGGTKDLLDIIRRFAPEANNVKVPQAKEIQILVATDILSEGLNLQDANRVINYDIHWNPVKLIQRIGRVDRVTTKHDTIWTYNFFPERKLEKHLGLEARVKNRIQEIHANIGEDAKYLTPDEQLVEHSFFKIYTGDESVLEEEPEETSFADLVQLIQLVKDNQPALYAKILALPHKVRSAKVAPAKDGLIVFCKSGEFYRLYLADRQGNVQSQDQIAILKALSCNPNEPRKPLPAGFNEKVMKIAAAFEEEAKQRDSERATGESDPIIRSILKDLKSAARGADDKAKAKVSHLRKRVLETTLTKRQRTEYRRLSRRVADRNEILDGLERILSSRQISLFDDQKKRPTRIIKAQIIASEGLV